MPVELGPKRADGEGKNKYRVSNSKVYITFCHLPKESSSDMPLTLLSLERSKARHKTTGLIAISRVLGVHNTLTAIGNNMVSLSIKQYTYFSHCLIGVVEKTFPCPYLRSIIDDAEFSRPCVQNAPAKETRTISMTPILRCDLCKPIVYLHLTVDDTGVFTIAVDVVDLGVVCSLSHGWVQDVVDVDYRVAHK